MGCARPEALSPSSEEIWTGIRQHIGVKSKDVNSALRLLDRHSYLAVYDDASNNPKIALHPDFYHCS